MGWGVGIAISGSNVYIIGTTETSAYVSTPCYWLNGTYTALPLPANASWGSGQAIAISGNNVYCSGFTTSSSVETPCYWLNGIYTVLPQPSSSINCDPWAIAISGNDVYIGGYTATSNISSGSSFNILGGPSTGIPCYWLNGAYIALPLGPSTTGGSTGYAGTKDLQVHR
jgi:hypothetical protein